ncbi:hypothetical protein ACFVHB_31840 [Kitasatospora sp. NPDC127111]|uniref:hypothetical protein n=1 Tax=Kitasatospora sp. NPDC127111 TaxID=3345363 RepID=UPI0036284FFD
MMALVRSVTSARSLSTQDMCCAPKKAETSTWARTSGEDSGVSSPCRAASVSQSEMSSV